MCVLDYVLGTGVPYAGDKTDQIVKDLTIYDDKRVWLQCANAWVRWLCHKFSTSSVSFRLDVSHIKFADAMDTSEHIEETP